MSPQSEQIFAVCHFDSNARAQQATSELQQIGINASSVQTISGESLQDASDSQINQQFLTAGVHADDAAHLQKELRSKGGVLAIVRTDASNEAQVDQIFRRYGAHETDEYATSQKGSRNAAPTGNNTLKVVEEELVVGKREVSRGGMRIYSRITETPVQENINLTDETVRVERHKVDRPISSADLDALGRDQVMEVTAKGEEAVVSKKARVVEEVSIGKESSQHTDTIRDTVRKTDVRVEKIDSELNKYFESDYKTRYGSTGQTYDTYAPAYQYGYSEANNAKYKGKSYHDVEQNLRSDYESRNPGGVWDNVKGAIETGWSKVTGR